MKLALTDLVLRKLPHPTKGQVRYFDENLPAFGVTVGAQSKTFIIVHGPRRVLSTIGRYPEVSLADARKEAKRLLVHPPEKTTSASLIATVDDYLKDCRTRLRPATLREYNRHLKIAPSIRLKELSKTKVDLHEPHAVNAWKVFANWCVRNELLEKNPFLHIPIVYGKRSRVLSDAEVSTIMNYEDGRFSDFLKLCILTGQRKTEVATFRQAWIVGDTVTVPASVAKNGKEHVIAFNLLTAKYLPEGKRPV